MKAVRKYTGQLALVDAIKNNDEVVLKNLYTSNYPKAQSLVLKNSGTIAEAKDVYQESFLAMYRNVLADKFAPQNETALQGYLYRIVSNKWRDVLRTSHKSKTVSSDLFKDNVSDSQDWNEDEELYTLMNKGLQQLGNACKILLQEFYYQKKSLREIAASMEIGEASARNKKYRCMEELKSIINRIHSK